MSRTWLTLAFGQNFDLQRPSADTVNFAGVSEQLAKIARWTGATPGLVISVAEHSVRVVRLVSAAAKPYALFHDGHETVLNDETRPVSRAMELELPGYHAARKRIADRVDAAIHAAAGLSWPPPPEIAREVAAADDRMLATELRWLFPPDVRPHPDVTRLIDSPFKPLPSWHAAHELFMAQLRQLLPHVLP